MANTPPPPEGQKDSLRGALRSAKRAVDRFRVLPLLLLYALSSAKEVIRLDTRRWLEETGQRDESDLGGLLLLLARYREFRNLYYTRTKAGSLPAAIFTTLLKSLYRECPSLLIMCDDIGPGLFIQHGFSTIIYAERIGADCWVNQQVTVGFVDDSGMPTIGNRVFIFAGAKVLGNITVGNHVMIGANAVVVKNVPEECTVAGVPARIVRRNGVRVDEPL